MNYNKSNGVNISETFFHDIKTPLSVILSTATLLDNLKFKPEADFFLDSIKKNTIYLNELIENYETIRFFNDEDYEMDYQKININNILKEILEIYNPLINLREASLKIISNCENDIIINSDRCATKRIIMNIISNAIKFSEDNKYIYIKIFKNEFGTSITVKNTSTLICCENLKIFWNQYAKLKMHNKKFFKQSLGVYIINELCEKLNYNTIFMLEKNTVEVGFFMKL